MLKELILQPRPSREINGLIRYECLLKKVDGGVSTGKSLLWFEYSDECELSSWKDSDQFLLAVLMDGMKEQRNIRVKGAVSLSLLRNLHEFQLYWSSMLPDIYSLVEIDPENTIIRKKVNENAICAFSGGIDSSFSIWQHSQIDVRWRLQNITMAVMVHGFDVPLSEHESFHRLFQRWKHPLEMRGVQLVSVRTNFREVSTASWEHTHGTAIAAGLNRYKTIAGNALIGSTEPFYNQMGIWGSNSFSDHLLGSSDFSFIHDGAAYRRLDKVRYLCRWPDGLENLQVCYEGKNRDENCGICEKCVRTQMTFKIQKLRIPDIFSTVRNMKVSLWCIRLKSWPLFCEWNQMRQYVISHRQYRLILPIYRLILLSRLHLCCRRMKRSLKSLFYPK